MSRRGPSPGSCWGCCAPLLRRQLPRASCACPSALFDSLWRGPAGGTYHRRSHQIVAVHRCSDGSCLAHLARAPLPCSAVFGGDRRGGPTTGVATRSSLCTVALTAAASCLLRVPLCLVRQSSAGTGGGDGYPVPPAQPPSSCWRKARVQFLGRAMPSPALLPRRPQLRKIHARDNSAEPSPRRGASPHVVDRPAAARRGEIFPYRQ